MHVAYRVYEVEEHNEMPASRSMETYTVAWNRITCFVVFLARSRARFAMAGRDSESVILCLFNEK